MPRAVSSVVGTILLVLLTVAIGTVIAVGAVSYLDQPAQHEPVSLSASATASDSQITVTHQQGPSLDTEAIRFVVELDGTSLTHQPPVPFFAARGFRAGPTGAFNSRGDTTLDVGERASFRLASTNTPALTPGTTVTVSVYEDDQLRAQAETTARE